MSYDAKRLPDGFDMKPKSVAAPMWSWIVFAASHSLLELTREVAFSIACVLMGFRCQRIHAKSLSFESEPQLHVECKLAWAVS
jgi:hypothetical protein